MATTQTEFAEEHDYQEVALDQLGVSSIRRSHTINEIIKALAAATIEFGEATKDTRNPFYNSTYADLATLISATRPHLSKHGLALLQFPLISGTRAGITSLLAHSSGEWMESEFTLPISKADAQGTGSAITYARRYAYQSILNVAGEQDDDGNAAVGKSGAVAQPFPRPSSVINATEARAFWAGVKQGNKSQEEVMAYFGSIGIEKTEEMKRKDFDSAMKWAVS